MSLQSIAQPDIAKVHAMLSKMDGPQLQQFAAANQNNAIYVSLAMQVDKDRKADMQRLQALMTGQRQPNVMQQVVAALNPQGMIPPGMGGQGGAPMPPPGGPQAPMPPQGMPMGAPPPGMQMPPPMPPAPQMPPPSGPGAAPQGLASLPAPNMQGMADGGIAGYADEDEAVGYADGGAVHMQAGGTPEAAMRAQLRSLNMPEQLIEIAVQRERMAAENAPQQRQLPFTPATTSAVSMFRDPGYDPFKNPPTVRQLYGDQPTLGTAAGAIEEMTRKNAAKDVFARPGMQQFVSDLEAGRVRPSAEEPGKVLPMTPGQGALNVPTAEQVSAALAAQKATPPATRSLGAARTGAPAAPIAPTPSAGITSLIPEGATAGKTPEQAIADAGKFSLGPQYTEGQTLLNRAGERQDQYLRDIFMQRPSKELGQKTEEYIKSQREELAAEKKDRGANFLISAGLAIASGTSRNAMQNIAQGLQVGVKDAQAAMKDFKAAQKELARMDADLENLRAAQKERDFDRVLSLEQRIADRDEGRKQKMFDGAMTLAGQDRALAGNIYSLAEQNAEQWKRTQAEFGFKRGEREAGQAFAATEGAKDRSNRLAAASIDKEGDRIRALGGGDLLAGYKALKEINGDKFSLPTAYADYMSKWKPNPMNPADRMLNGQEFAAQMGSLYTTTKPPADATILKRP